MIDIDQSFQLLAATCRKSLGKCAPNPNVAAALYTSAGELISIGGHNRLQSADHAEVVAIKAAGDLTRGATMVVSLEPCNHHGATPPCVDAIIDAGITRVIYGVRDPNPVAAGGGERLKSAGIEVEYVESHLLEGVQQGWLHKITTGRPYFIWKIATSLDGRIAAADGTSQWISSEQSRADVQILRSQSDAILIGTGTALADNPTLRPRIDGANSPIRIVVGNREIPSDFNLHDGASRTIFIKSNDIKEILRDISEAPVNQVLVEAGPTLGSALFAAGLIDEVVLYQAPIALGAGKSWLGDIGVQSINGARALTLISSEEIGPDMKLRYRVENR